MIRSFLLPATALLLTAGSACAQDSGGIGFPASGIAPANMAQAFAQPIRQPVFANPQKRGAPPGAMVTNPTVSRSAANQQAITRIRGDAGFLGGFNKGQALAVSRQPPPVFAPPITFIDAPFIVNNVNSSLNFAFGDGNVSEQQSAQISGDVVQAPAAPAVQGPAAQPSSDHHRHPPAVSTPPAPPPVPKQVSVPNVPMPNVPMPNVNVPKPDPLMTTMGPLPHLPYALANGGVQFNNVNSAVNMAVGTGNTATQRAKIIQK